MPKLDRPEGNRTVAPVVVVLRSTAVCAGCRKPLSCLEQDCRFAPAEYSQALAGWHAHSVHRAERLKNQRPQPAMNGICIHPRVPSLYDAKARHGDRQVKGLDLAYRGGLAIRLRSRADQIGCRRNCNHRRKTWHDQSDITGKAQFGERPVDRTGKVRLH